MSTISRNLDFTEVLANRLRDLREEKRLSWDRLAEAMKDGYGIQIHRDTLKFYEAKGNHSKAGNNKAMKAEYLYCLADFYGVSVDYLLGRTDTRSPNADIQAIMQKTALSESTVHELIGTYYNGKNFLSPLFDDIASISHEIIADYLLLTNTSNSYSPTQKDMSIDEIARIYAISKSLDEYGETSVTKRDYMRYLTAEIGNAISNELRKKYIPGYDNEG